MNRIKTKRWKKNVAGVNEVAKAFHSLLIIVKLKCKIESSNQCRMGVNDWIGICSHIQTKR